MEMPVLKVGKSSPVRPELLLPFPIDIEIGLVCGFLIILVVVGESTILSPGYQPIVSSVITIPAASKGKLGAIFVVLKGKNSTIKIVVQPALPDQVCARQGSFPTT